MSSFIIYFKSPPPLVLPFSIDPSSSVNGIL